MRGVRPCLHSTGQRRGGCGRGGGQAGGRAAGERLSSAAALPRAGCRACRGRAAPGFSPPLPPSQISALYSHARPPSACAAADAGKKVELTPGMFLEHDHDVSAVVMGVSRLGCAAAAAVAAAAAATARAPGRRLGLRERRSAAGAGAGLQHACGQAVGRPTTSPVPCPAHSLSILQVAAVVVGFDRNINYYKIQMATLCIRENPGCMFIATNLGEPREPERVPLLCCAGLAAWGCGAGRLRGG